MRCYLNQKLVDYSAGSACQCLSCVDTLEPERQDVLDLLLEVRSALSAGEIEERTKHSAAAHTPLAEALRASAKVDALPDGRFRYKVLAWAVMRAAAFMA